MGIYPTTTDEMQGDLLVRAVNNFSGLVRTTVYQPVLVIEERTTCYCCSCGEGTSDPYCRNHGFAGLRPCEKHDMPGQADEDDVMPASVQEYRRKVGHSNVTVQL